MPEEKILNISGASRFLGVSEPALRQWTDEHKVKAFVTPGGHRRYSVDELKKFMHSHQKLFGIKDLALHMEESALEHRHLDSSFLKDTFGHKMNVETQTQFAALGREILTFIIRSIREPSHQEEILKSVRENGTKFGVMTAGLNMSLSDSIHAFVQHRELLMRVTTEIMKTGEGVQRRVVEAISLVDHVMDEALVALVLAHQYIKHTSTDIKPRTAEGINSRSRDQ